MAVPDNGNAEIVHILFHGIGTPGPGVSAADQGYFIDKDLFLGVLDEIKGQPRVELQLRRRLRLRRRGGPAGAAWSAGCPPRFFPLAGQLGRPGYLSPAGVRELSAAGMASAPTACGIAPGAAWTRRPGRRSWCGPVGARERGGAPVEAAACPFGAYDRGHWPRCASSATPRSSPATAGGPGRAPGCSPATACGARTPSRRCADNILARPPADRAARGALAARVKAWR